MVDADADADRGCRAGAAAAVASRSAATCHSGCKHVPSRWSRTSPVTGAMPSVSSQNGLSRAKSVTIAEMAATYGPTSTHSQRCV